MVQQTAAVMNTSITPAKAAIASKSLSKNLQNPSFENFIYTLPQIPSLSTGPLPTGRQAVPTEDGAGSSPLPSGSETALGRRLRGERGDYIIYLLNGNGWLYVLAFPTPHPHPFESV